VTARIQGWVYWFDKTTDPPRQLCCPTDAFSDLGARNCEVRFSSDSVAKLLCNFLSSVGRHQVKELVATKPRPNDRLGSRLCENALFAVIRAIRFPAFAGHLMKRFVEGVNRGQSTLFPASLDDYDDDGGARRRAERGWMDSVSPASAASRSVLGAI
jgi:hypothetical protein